MKPARLPRRRGRLDGEFAFSLLVLAVAATAFVLAFNPSYLRTVAGLLTAPVAEAAENRMTDQHFSGCNAARAAGREDIPSWDPSYRPEMDGDGDGLACEPYR